MEDFCVCVCSGRSIFLDRVGERGGVRMLEGM